MNKKWERKRGKTEVEHQRYPKMNYLLEEAELSNLDCSLQGEEKKQKRGDDVAVVGICK